MMLLRTQRFPQIFASQILSYLADQLYLIALPWLILQLAGSAFAVGSVFALAAIPRAVLVPIGGIWADRVGPRKIMISVSLIRGLVLLGVMALLQSHNVWILYPAALILGTASAFYYPAENSMIPRIVPKDLLQSANSLVQGANQLLGILGPALGGVAVGLLGGKNVLLIAALVYGCAALCLLLVEELDMASGAVKQSVLKSISEGIAFVRSDGTLSRLFFVMAFVNLGFTGSFSIGVPLLVRNTFGLGSEYFGFLATSFSIGSLIGLFLSTMTSKVQAKGKIAVAGLVLANVAMGSLAAVSRPTPAFVLLLLVGIGLGISNVIMITLVQLRTPMAMLGRLMSIALLFSFGLIPVSQFMAGLLAEYFGVSTLFLSGASISLFALLLGGKHIALLRSVSHAPQEQPT